MTEATSYPIDTLLDMAAIPEEALSRFLDELPEIIAATRKVKAAHSTFNILFGGELEASLNGASWIDDGERNATLTLSIFGEDECVISIKPSPAS